jgi:hypothetical protein
LGPYLLLISRYLFYGLQIRNNRLLREKNRPYYSLLDGGSVLRWPGVREMRKNGCFDEVVLHSMIWDKSGSQTVIAYPARGLLLMKKITMSDKALKTGLYE